MARLSLAGTSRIASAGISSRLAARILATSTPPSSKTSSSTLSSDFTNLEKHVNELVETTMKSEKQVNELKHRLLLATNALKEATGGAGKSGDPLGKS